ncbi:MAG: MATE family efflux transporter [Clostridia bacterium]|nr:MATE family efflux transporter [Clostridia bacterium]
MFHSHSHRNIEMTEGSLWRNTILFALPLLASGILQLLFNAADTIVVGRFSGQRALAAVGSVGSLTSLIVNLFMGLSTGTNVVVAQFIGAKDHSNTRRAVHTAVTVSVIGGAALGLIGFILARPILTWMDSPADVIDLSVLYVRIIFLGLPVQMLYNFSAAILRAVGDTKRPLYFLTAAGVINVLLNLFFVIALKMSVAGVALATVLSQAVSATLVVRSLILREDWVHLELKKLGINPRILGKIAKIGLPSGIQGSMFSISNVLIQSSVNSFGTIAMAGNAAAANICSFVHQGVQSIAQTVTAFVGQNMGARKPRRILRVMGVCQVWNLLFTGILGAGSYILGEKLLALYNTNPEVIRLGMERMLLVNVPYFILGIYDVFSGALRGIGYSLLPMFIALMGICALRIGWVTFVFHANPSFNTLFWSYPVSWSATAVVMGLAFCILFRRTKRQFSPLELAAE